MANIEYHQLSDVERGKTNATISTVYALAKASDIRMTEIFDVSEF